MKVLRIFFPVYIIVHTKSSELVKTGVFFKIFRLDFFFFGSRRCNKIDKETEKPGQGQKRPTNSKSTSPGLGWLEFGLKLDFG